MGLGLGRGLVGLFKQWGKGIGNAADHVWLREDAQKAIRDEITKKYQPKIDRVLKGESRKADNIKDLGNKVNQSKKDLADAQKAWQDKYNNELAAAQNQRQLDFDNYNAQLKTYNDALDNANASRQSILDQLRDNEVIYDPSRTLFTDVSTGDKYIFDQITGQYRNLTKIYPTLTKKQQRDVRNSIQGYDNRLLDSSKSFKLVNAFDNSDINNYGKSKWFKEYSDRIKAQNTNLRDAENEINRANSDLTNWTVNNSKPKAWGTRDLNQFKQDFKNNNVEPTGYSFNGKNYSDESALKDAYQKALDREQNKRNLFKTKASNYASERDAEIAQRIQDAKDINKAKLALAGTLGAGALYAGAKAIYGSDDTDTDNTDNINNIDNTNYGKPDPEFKAENTPEGKAGLNGKSIDTGFDPDEADAVATLAAAAHDKGVEDSNSIESSGDLGNNIAATTGGHTIDDRLFELLKAMEDPYKADAIANYIYSRHGDDPEVQNLGWRGWLNKYYGDSLRSMGIDPSGYKGMHISGGL